MLGVMRETFEEEEASISGLLDFFSVASTMPFAAFMPREVTPWFTALSAYSVLYQYYRDRCGRRSVVVPI